MIRKFGAVEASPEEALETMLDIESWPKWMPNIRSTRVLDRTKGRVVAEVDRSEHGRVHRTKLEFLIAGNGYTERQISGLAKSWQGDWRFRPAPSGRGSVVSCKMDIDLGFFGFFIPRRTVQRTVDRTFARILDGIDVRLRRRGEVAPGARRRTALEDVERIQVFETPTGLEIWLDDRRYIARRVE